MTQRLAATANAAQTDGVYIDRTTGEVVTVINGAIVKRTSPTGITLPKASGTHVKVDLDSPSYAWADMLVDIKVKGVAGAKTPVWTTYNGHISGYQFAVGDECWVEFHMPHDYAPGTDIFIHAHWSLNVAGVTEDIVWDFDLSYAKGHQQAAFSAPVTSMTAAHTSSTTQYFHMISEVQCSVSGGSATQLDTDDLEVDGLILVHVELNSNTGATDPFLHFVDIHYQTTGVMGTKDKAPDFYS